MLQLMEERDGNSCDPLQITVHGIRQEFHQLQLSVCTPLPTAGYKMQKLMELYSVEACMMPSAAISA